ncbi:type II secretion system F family protein [Tessaracoccus rhinocerotis]|nr:type II secretion system F family protein [Tessaracoccus rhinocerotis]
MIAGTIGALLALGVTLVVAGLMKREQSTELSPDLWKRVAKVWESSSRRSKLWVVGSLAAGVLLAVVSGWLAATVLVPVFAIGIPALLKEPRQHEIDVLAALDRWVRLLAPSIATGKSIRDAVIATRQQAPAVLVQPVNRLVARIDQGWTTRDALLTMADELDSADGDAVLAALAIASSRGGVGTRATLTALSANTQDRLRALREIAAERAKPRAVVRQVTLITLVVLGASVLLGGEFFDAYRTPLGQVLALGIGAAYIGSLAILRRRTVPAPTARFLRGSA